VKDDSTFWILSPFFVEGTEAEYVCLSRFCTFWIIVFWPDSCSFSQVGFGGGDLPSHYHFAVVVAVSRLPDNGASSKDVGDCFVWICFVRDVD